MKPENRKKLRDSLVGKTITDVIFHNSHGMVIDIVLDNATRMVVCTYDDHKPHEADDFYVELNEEEL